MLVPFNPDGPTESAHPLDSFFDGEILERLLQCVNEAAPSQRLAVLALLEHPRVPRVVDELLNDMELD